MLISLGGVPGFLCAAWLVERWGRKPTCIASLIGGGVMAYAYGQSALYGGSMALLIGTGLAMQFFLFGMWAALYTHTPELYGTGARATGSGFASAIGRVGSLIGPYVVGVVLPVFGQAACSRSARCRSSRPRWPCGRSGSKRRAALEQLAAGDEAGGSGRYAAAAD